MGNEKDRDQEQDVDEYIDLVDPGDPLEPGGFELDEDDDRLHLVGSALDYADPEVVGNLSLIRDGVADDVGRDLLDLEEGGFDAGRLMFGRSLSDPGSVARDHFNIKVLNGMRRVV